jgi:HSP20 family protein
MFLPPRPAEAKYLRPSAFVERLQLVGGYLIIKKCIHTLAFQLRMIIIHITNNEARKEVSNMTRMLQLIPRKQRYLPVLPDIDFFDRFFNSFPQPTLFGGEEMLVPDFDISETEKEYVISGEIPGIDVKDLHVTLTNGIITIKGEKKKETEDNKKNYHFVERHYGSFERSFRIPDSIKTDELDAQYKDGILKLTLPKAEVSEVKKIEVKEKKAGKKKIKAKKA